MLAMTDATRSFELATALMPAIARADRLGFAWLEAKLRPKGITVADFRIVGSLLGEQEGLSQRELAARLGVRPPTVSVALDKLEQAGIVERLPSASDARAHRASQVAGRECLSRIPVAGSRARAQAGRGAADPQ